MLFSFLNDIILCSFITCNVREGLKLNYNKTFRACCFGYFVQSFSFNLLPLLYVFFVTNYKIPLYLISFIATYAFVLQIVIDLVSYKIINKIGFLKTIYLSCGVNVFGLILLGLVPYIFSSYLQIYIGIVVAITFISTSAGMTEVVYSPLIESLPLKNKSAKMSFLHSFYSIGHILIVLIATGFFYFVGIKYWQILVFLLTIIPITTIILFSNCPIYFKKEESKRYKREKIFKNKTFLLLFVIILFGGASEISIAQWISYFAESGLKVNKALGDLIGCCTFALFMIISRLYFGKSSKKRNTLLTIFFCSIGLIACYLLSVFLKINLLSLFFLALGGFFVGIMWPGVYAIAGEIFKEGGTFIFAMLALGGDIGCTIGPFMVGLVADAFSIKMGLLIATLFPIIVFLASGILILKIKNKKL